MAKEITLEIKLKLIEEAGDGTKCECCGDSAWLKQYRVCGFIAERKDAVFESEIVVCSSCRDGINF